ncbi:MAG: hypothetical protein LQ338_000839 [Usnochroma carphineum]|nr:MAG: hypothetical protein LQ338_000839 [Usnochroma carphineum]
MILSTSRKIPSLSISAQRRCFISTTVLPDRPSIAPKPSLNIKHIRENPELYSQTCIDRNYLWQKDSPHEIIQKFDEWKALQLNVRTLRRRRNEIRTKLSHAKTFSGIEALEAGRPSQDDSKLFKEAKALKIEIEKVEAQEDTLNQRIDYLANNLPNLTSKATPIGAEPRVLGYINDLPNHPTSTDDHTWRNHVHIGSEFDLLDFTSAGKTSGWGWYYLKNEGALLEQALIQYAFSVALKHGFSAVSPPSMVYTHIADACGFHPRDQGGEQQTYAIAQKDERGRQSHNGQERTPEKGLAGTAEIPFAGMKANVVLHEKDLPLRIFGASRCYRAEAGARGAETKGLYRVHEFTKVEMFAWTMRDKEQGAFDSMLAVQKEILQSLGLYCRLLEMPSQDLGASAVRKVDIEAFFPSRRGKTDGWGEVTSASICTDYQTRRLQTRVKPALSSKTEFSSTVNGTALAVPRILAAILENGWDGYEKHVKVPKVLYPWMHGIQDIEKSKTQRRSHKHSSSVTP